MINSKEALAMCRRDPVAAARLIIDLSEKADAWQCQIDLLSQKISGLEKKKLTHPFEKQCGNIKAIPISKR